MTSPNADLLQRMNLLKQHLSPEILTPPQEQVYEQILSQIEQGESRINLVGKRDVGKTVVCWVLAEELGWEYLPDPDLDPSRSKVIFDHAAPNRQATRRLRAEMQLNNLTQIVYVTRTPAREIYPRIELDPDSETHPTRISDILETSHNNN